MAPRVERIQGDDRPPASTQVVVIGGGIIGVSAALVLAERGIPVVLCEKGHVAGEQSSRNWGWCRQQGRDPRELPLIVESLRLWRGMNARVGAETGFRQCGDLVDARCHVELSGGLHRTCQFEGTVADLEHQHGGQRRQLDRFAGVLPGHIAQPRLDDLDRLGNFDQGRPDLAKHRRHIVDVVVIRRGQRRLRSFERHRNLEHRAIMTLAEALAPVRQRRWRNFCRTDSAATVDNEVNDFPGRTWWRPPSTSGVSEDWR